MKRNNIFQLLFQNRKNGSGSLNIQNHGDTAVVYLYDTIVDSDEDAEWFGGVSAESFAKQFAEITAPTIHLRVNSPGGSVFGGRVMETAIRNHTSKVVVFVDGLAASAASFLIMAADEIEMSKGAFLMIHKAWTFAYGNSDDLTHQALVLNQIDDSLVATYAERTQLPTDELRDMMAVETWLDAETAVSKGFANRVSENSKAKNCWNLSAYEHAPMIAEEPTPEPSDNPSEPPPEPPPEPEPQPDREAMARAVAVALVQTR